MLGNIQSGNMKNSELQSVIPCMAFTNKKAWQTHARVQKIKSDHVNC